ncbi:hypothetical protein ACOMHN_020644 [Nucella lapillus]
MYNTSSNTGQVACTIRAATQAKWHVQYEQQHRPSGMYNTSSNTAQVACTIRAAKQAKWHVQYEQQHSPSGMYNTHYTLLSQGGYGEGLLFVLGLRGPQ